MNILKNILKKINKFSKKIKIIFPEGNSEKIQKIAKKLIKTNIKPILVFATRKEISKKIYKLQSEILVIEEQNKLELAKYLVELRKEKISLTEAKKLVCQSNYLSILWVKKKFADGMVGGINYNSKDIIKPALQIIKAKSNIKLVSSFFLMIRNNKNYIFTDCALNIDPTDEELANIAYLGYKASQIFNFKNPNIALLSFSTKNSGHGISVNKVRSAYKILQTKKIKNCFIDGEFQFDTAWNKNIKNKKAPLSKLKVPADIFVFPNLDAGNIGYKIAQQLGKFKAIGPIIIGLEYPINDLSRGSTINDIYYTVLITAYLSIIN